MAHDKLRLQILAETARLMREGQEPSLGRARVAAARSLTRCWVRPDDFPSDHEVRGQVFRHVEMLHNKSASTSTAREDSGDARLEVYRSLLEPLSQVLQSRDQHPEGDALYHSLQVFVLMQRESAWDEELQLAALLHDVGKGIDPREHVSASLAALDGWITERTAWLIANHADAQRIYDGTLGTRALRRLSEHADFECLLLLARCDRDGRVPGADVPDVSQALESIRMLARLCDGEPAE